MSDIIVAGLLMGGIIGLPIGLIIAIGRDTWWGKVLSFIICCSVFFRRGRSIWTGTHQ